MPVLDVGMLLRLKTLADEMGKAYEMIQPNKVRLLLRQLLLMLPPSSRLPPATVFAAAGLHVAANRYAELLLTLLQHFVRDSFPVP